jgi:O-antigen/teichoic acid export membrane protein
MKGPPRSPFARRVAGVFTARVLQFGIGMVTAFLLSRLLGPAGRGEYALAILVPSTLFALGQLGLPSAFIFFAGGGRAGRSLWRRALWLGITLSLVLLLVALLALPALEASVMQTAPEDLVRVALASLPFQFLASFCGAILIGRQTLLVYNSILVAQSLLSLGLVVVLVGIADLGPAGAVIGSVVGAAVGAAVVVVAVRVTTDPAESGTPLRIGELGRFGLRVYPASVTGFFNYRIDIYLLGFLLVGSSETVSSMIGLYTLAVSLAELTFFVPDSVATVFFPRVAGSERRSADEMTPMVTRMTVLVTVLVAIALIPAAFAAVHLILPAFVGSIPAFLLILPGIVALAVAKVLSSYVSGIGRPTPVTVAAIVALAVNLVANVVLIPLIGILGASLASTISYAVNTAVLVIVAVRLTGRSPWTLLIPTRSEVERLVTVAASVRRRLARGGRGEPGGADGAAP